MSDKREVLADGAAAWTELVAALGGLDEAARRARWLGAWGVREIVAHVAGWHREMIPALARLGRGEAPYPPGAYDDGDAWNARFVEAHAAVAPAALLAELEASHRDFMAAARALPDALFAPGTPARELFEGVGPAHYREHAAQILAWRQGVAAAPGGA